MAVTARLRIPRVRGAGEVIAGAVPAALALVVLMGGWEAVGRLAGVAYFPPLSAVLARLGELVASGQIVGNLLSSLTNLVIGFAISLAIALVVGTLMGAFKKVEVALDVYVNALLTAPSLVFAPIFFTIWGLGREPIISIVVMYSCFVMTTNVAAAVRNAPRNLVEMGVAFGASHWQRFRLVILPAVTPLVMAGVRLGAGRAVKGMINGEMFIAVVGLGKVIQDAGRGLDAAAVLAVLIVVVLVAFAAVAIVQAVDARLTAWLPPSSRSS